MERIVGGVAVAKGSAFTEKGMEGEKTQAGSVDSNKCKEKGHSFIQILKIQKSCYFKE